jgi:uncharacterized repeat protein (TIGR01451 family)
MGALLVALAVTGVLPLPGTAFADSPPTISKTFGSAASIDGDAPPTLAAAFSPDDIRPSGTSQLTFTIGNPNTDQLTGIGFTDTLPTGLTVPDGSAPVCGGTLTTMSPTSISFTGGTLAADEQCQVPVIVTATTDGQFTNTAAMSSTQGGGGASAPTTLTAAWPPTISAGFGTTLLGLNGTAPLTFTIVNPNQNVSLTGIGFDDTLPPGLVIVGPFAPGNTCGGAVTTSAGSDSVALSSAHLAPGASCIVAETIAATGVGLQTDTTDAVSSNEGGAGNAASAAVTVVGAPTVTLASPVGGRAYAFGQQVRAAYSCADDPNGPGIGICLGDAAAGALVNTSKAGAHTFTVTAVSKDGGIASDIVFYTVKPDNHFKIGTRHVHSDGSIELAVTVPGPGALTVTETISHGHIVFGRQQSMARRAGKLHLTIRPSARGRRAAQQQHSPRVTVTVAFTPRGGTRRVVRLSFTA